MKFSIQKDQILFAILFSIIYLIWNYGLVGLKSDHILFAVLISGGSLIHRNIFKFYLGFSAFIIFWIIYDGLQVYPNYEVNSISIQELFDLELKYFGFDYNGDRIIPNQYFLTNQVPILSFFLGLAYLMWMPAPLAFSGYLFYKNRRLLIRYSYCFLFVNLIGFIGYYLYPAAPPWYYFKYGTELHTNINGDPGLLVNFDKIVGFPVFDSIYNRGANVFAAIPSLHCSFTIINMYYAVKSKRRSFIIIFIFLALGTWIGAIYSQHHYIIDVLLGFLTAGLALGLYEGLNFKRFFNPLTEWVSEKIVSNS